MTAERESRELRALVAELEGTIQSKYKKDNDILNSKVQILEQQLNTENVERSNLQRNQRRLEKRLAEMNAQLEEERRTTNQFKEEVFIGVKSICLIEWFQAERSNAKVRQNRSRINEIEEELSREKAKVRGLQRQLDDIDQWLQNN